MKSSTTSSSQSPLIMTPDFLFNRIKNSEKKFVVKEHEDYLSIFNKIVEVDEGIEKDS